MPTKPRKPHKPYQIISPENWRLVEVAVCSGMSWTEAAHKFGINDSATIKMRAKRHSWVLPAKIVKRVEQLRTRKNVTQSAVRSNNEKLLEVVAESWVQRAERHKVVAFDLAHKALADAAKSGGIPLDGWKDADLADKIARRSSGLDSRDKQSGAAAGMTLVNMRIERMLVGLPPNPTASETVDAEPGEPGE
jgi:hypothetical protein